MIDNYHDNKAKMLSLNEALMNSASHVDSKTAIVFGCMFCITVMFCVGSVIFSASELHLSRNGISITQPSKKSSFGCRNESDKE